MSLKDLEAFLNDGEESGQSKFDWDKEKKRWLEAVDRLFTDVTSWLEPLSANPNFNIRFEKITLQEEQIGEYETKRMIIELKGQKAALEPIGTMIIGSRGRIDLKGSNGTVKFVLVDKRLNKPKVTVNIFTEKEYSQHLANAQGKPSESTEPVEYVWKIVTPPPNVQFFPLNEETFSDALLQVIRNGW
ncbi:hypothetical protein [Bacillus sp. T33-2]|uniref:hypothetical protein n=1 Tax=Bacillus sp. T33-2 TaxID=2054168 RepID=UPI000C785EF5|nr:hypothetical protein [Bacillus sp. T33-2]PLR90900.1 hypothetical protein CVD19_22165 [Bacillus sp. T33-2]